MLGKQAQATLQLEQITNIVKNLDNDLHCKMMKINLKNISPEKGIVFEECSNLKERINDFQKNKIKLRTLADDDFIPLN